MLNVNLQAQLANPELNQICLTSDDVVKFNNILMPSDVITYDQSTGVFSINYPGTYLFIWNIAVDGSYMMPYVRFGLSVNGNTDAPSASPVSHGSVTSSELVKVTALPTLVTLTNYTDDTVCLSAVDPPANLSVIRCDGISENQSIIELIYSIAIGEYALAGVIDAEAKKIKAAINMPGVTVDELLSINQSVEQTLSIISDIEKSLATKLKLGLSKKGAD